MADRKPHVLRRLDYTPPTYAIDTVDLRVAVGLDAPTRVRARLGVRRAEGVPASAPLRLDGSGLRLLRVALDGVDLPASAFEVAEEELVVRDVPAAFLLETEVEIEPDRNTALEGLYRTSTGYLTQCEAEGFRKITYYADRPDVLARFTTEVIADKERFPVLLANGNLAERSDLPGGLHRTLWVDPFPKPCYLFALVAADLTHIEDSFTTRSGRRVTLRIYAQPRNIDKCAHAMACLQHAMRWDEATFGLECDLDHYSIVVTDDFNMGAMENKGLNIFNSQYVLASPATASDADYAAIEGVIGHEYFHNWTGNRVTCRDWFQLSLKEGLTVFRDQQFSAAMGSPATKRIEEVRRLRAGQFPEDAGPMAHPVRPDEVIEINNFYTATVYEKGAEVVRMYHTLLGADGFRRGMDLYFQRHDGQAVTCDDFRAAMADANGRDLAQFERWYAQAGTPLLEVATRHDAAAATYTIEVRQSTPPTPGQTEKLPLHLPLAVALIAGDGRKLPLRLRGETGAVGDSRVLELTEGAHEFVFVDVKDPPVASLLRGFSAPVHLRVARTAEDLAFLMAHDDDSVSRWDAGQQLALDVLIEAVGRTQSAPSSSAMALVRACRVLVRQILDGSAGLDRALVAEVLTFPSEAMVGDAMASVDPEAIHAARERTRRLVASELREELQDLHTRLVDEEPPQHGIEAPHVARRALKHVSLSLLMALDEPAVWDRAERQLAAAGNMTDRMSALLNLAHSSTPARRALLEAFYDRFAAESLVVDKWLRVQASAPRPDVLDDVQRLMQHPAFTFTNPNKVRALLGAFVGNQRAFHGADGRGYTFVADQIAALQKLNPQVAARLTAAAFSRWRRFDRGRQARMRAEIERIAAIEGLARDVYEIASRCLA
ncbi:MAG: aminopeptidase N [Planctomycetota bacterium]